METNDLLKLLELFPDAAWDYGKLSANPNMTWEYISKHPDKKWSFHALSENPSLQWETVEANADLSWSFYWLSIHPNITWEIVKTHPNKGWWPSMLAMNPNFSWEIITSTEFIKKFGSLPSWAYYQSSDLRWDNIKDNLEVDFPEFRSLPAHRNITWDIIKANPDLPWNYTAFSENPNIRWDIIEANPKKEWSYNLIARNAAITLDILMKFHDKFESKRFRFNYEWFSLNPNLTWKIVADNVDKDWDFKILSQNAFKKDRNYKFLERKRMQIKKRSIMKIIRILS